MSEAEFLIASAAVTGRDRWSEVAAHLAREAIVDTLAVAVPGHGSPHARMAAETVLPAAVAHDGSHQLVAPLLSDARSYAVGEAAFVMGTAIHSMDWDDFMHPMHGHCSVVLLGALLPLAEALDAEGEALLGAFMAGYQVDWLASLALSHEHYRKGWHATSTIGVLGAAGAAAHLLELDVETTSRALGIAASMAGGIRANFGTTTKALHAGGAARSGINAALLARAGASSSPDWLVGPAGMIAAFGGEHLPTTAAQEVRRGVSERFGRLQHGIETEWGRVQKPYACCGSIHGAVDALLTVLSRPTVPPEDVRTIVAYVDPIVLDIMRYVRPLSPEQARYSPTWVLAAAGVDQAAGPAQFSDTALTRQEIHELRERVEVLGEWETDDDHRFGGRVEVHWQGGHVETHEVGESQGHPRRPMSDTDLSAKVSAALGDVVPTGAVKRLASEVEGVIELPVRQTMGTLREAILHELSSVYSLQYAPNHASNESPSLAEAQDKKVGTP